MSFTFVSGVVSLVVSYVVISEMRAAGRRAGICGRHQFHKVPSSSLVTGRQAGW